MEARTVHSISPFLVNSSLLPSYPRLSVSFLIQYDLVVLQVEKFDNVRNTYMLTILRSRVLDFAT